MKSSPVAAASCFIVGIALFIGPIFDWNRPYFRVLTYAPAVLVFCICHWVSLRIYLRRWYCMLYDWRIESDDAAYFTVAYQLAANQSYLKLSVIGNDGQPLLLSRRAIPTFYRNLIFLMNTRRIISIPPTLQQTIIAVIFSYSAIRNG